MMTTSVSDFTVMGRQTQVFRLREYKKYQIKTIESLGSSSWSQGCALELFSFCKPVGVVRGFFEARGVERSSA
jgi:hypothetical protein